MDSARQLLLKNASTAADKIRRRFATELHDDALQKLTAAELHLTRTQSSSPQSMTPSASFSKPRTLCGSCSLRSARRRWSSPVVSRKPFATAFLMLRSLTGIEADVDLELPDDVVYEIKSLVFRQVSEAITNVEKHAAATRVQVKVKSEGGGIAGVVVDNGRVRGRRT